MYVRLDRHHLGLHAQGVAEGAVGVGKAAVQVGVLALLVWSKLPAPHGGPRFSPGLLRDVRRFALGMSGITITASAKVTINASQVAVSAGMVTVDAAMSKFSGVVQCDTMISNSVISASYTPGAGNIW